jgi:hypothetical protein
MGGVAKYICDVAWALAREHKVAIACRPGSDIERLATEVGVCIVPLTIRRLHDWGKLERVYECLLDGSGKKAGGLSPVGLS